MNKELKILVKGLQLLDIPDNPVFAISTRDDFIFVENEKLVAPDIKQELRSLNGWGESEHGCHGCHTFDLLK